MIQPEPWMDPAQVSEMAMNIDAQLTHEMAYYYDKPYEFVMDMFPWGEKGTPLEHAEGPDAWQTAELKAYGKSIRERGFNGKDPVVPYRSATASGHGIGKTALVSWLIMFIMSTRPQARGVITASTSPQLETKTWSELGKWYRLCATSHWFKITSGKGSMKLCHVSDPQYWRCDALTCAKENADSFQGLHSATSTPFFIFDEASGIPPEIWVPANGGLTDGEPAWWVFGNPTKNTGEFHKIFHGMQHRWDCKQIDSRTTKMANKKLIEEWIEDWGEDSDYVRVRVKGVFPRVGDRQLISQESITAARRREAKADIRDPLVIGLDVARDPAGDQSVFCFRKGLDARTHTSEKHRGVDATFLAGRCEYWIEKLKPDAVFIDATGGWGAAVVDKLHRLGYQGLVFGIHFSEQASRPNEYANKRAEMWIRMKDHLDLGLAIEDDNDLERELLAPTFDYHGKREALIIEPKRDIKVRLGPGASPDHADALALTYARNVMPREYAGGQPRKGPQSSNVLNKHNPWGDPETQSATWSVTQSNSRVAAFHGKPLFSSYVLIESRRSRGPATDPRAAAFGRRCTASEVQADHQGATPAWASIDNADHSARRIASDSQDSSRPGWECLAHGRPVYSEARTRHLGRTR